MNKLTTLAVVFVFACNIVSAQKNLQPGYIIQNNNDTLKGFINYREWDKNPVSVQFAATKESALTKYDKTEISYFEISGKEAYARATINISLDPDQFDKLADKDTSTRTDIVFMKILFRGSKLSLFSYSDEIKLRYYLLKRDETTPVELKNSTYLLNGQLKNEYEYRNQLFTEAQKVFPGDASKIQLISKSEYTKSDLLNICYQLDGTTKNPKTMGSGKSSVNFLAGIGLNIASMGFSGQNRYSGNKSTISYSPMLSAAMDIFFNPEIGKLFLRTQLNATGAKCESFAEVDSYESTDHYKYEMKETSIALRVQVNYHLYNKSTFKWFIGAGGEGNYIFYSKNKQTITSVGLNSTTVSINDHFIQDIRKLGLSAAVTTGVSIRYADLAFTYLPGINLSGSSGYALNYSSLQFQLFYRFGKK